jgi:hypothetical protein
MPSSWPVPDHPQVIAPILSNMLGELELLPSSLSAHPICVARKSRSAFFHARNRRHGYALSVSWDPGQSNDRALFQGGFGAYDEQDNQATLLASVLTSVQDAGCMEYRIITARTFAL